MTVEVKVPQLPESVTDATLVAWHKAPGQAVRRDENLVDLETDKVVLEVPAPVGGVIKEIQVAQQVDPLVIRKDKRERSAQLAVRPRLCVPAI